MTTDTRLALLTRDMNATQRRLFLQAADRIQSAGWTWKQSTVTGLFHVYSEKNHFLGAGVSLVNALAESERAK